MNLLPGLLCLPAICLLLLAMLPYGFANRRVNLLSWVVNGLAVSNALAAFTALIWSTVRGPGYIVIASFGQNLPVNVSAYFDGVSSLMLTLVASIGCVICRFSIRYLDGEENQGNYFRWTGFTLGAISVAVVAGNLVLLVAGLLLTSLGLHQLLVHYADRPAARRAASLKFWFSRLGDVSLVAAAVLLYHEFGTLELPAIFDRAGSLSESDIANSTAIFAAGWLLVLCAIFKSAQFPFHTWLPETMEAPTPVSALMHAGIVNAGGYLLIRLAPVVSLAPASMLAAAGLGAFTAFFAALVMLSQTSVKRSLAWSTIAQMGFMIFQCGLGAYSAAMLHIIAHSLYKAHAFLSSGTVMQERAAMATTPTTHRSARIGITCFLTAVGVVALLYVGLAAIAGMSFGSKPGGYLLGFILCLGLSRWLSQNLATGWSTALPGTVQSACLVTAYLTSFKAVDLLVSVNSSMPAVTLPNGYLLVAAAIAFALLPALEFSIKRGFRTAWMQSLYVLSSNGFYLDTFWRRAAKSFSS